MHSVEPVYQPLFPTPSCTSNWIDLEALIGGPHVCACARTCLPSVRVGARVNVADSANVHAGEKA